jgi:Transposase IS66 family
LRNRAFFASRRQTGNWPITSGLLVIRSQWQEEFPLGLTDKQFLDPDRAEKERTADRLEIANTHLSRKGGIQRVVSVATRDPDNRRLANHLWRERPYLFTFLYCPGLDATNHRAERAVRALIGARKNWGGNRTWKGARAQAVLTSVIQTGKQRGKDPFQLLLQLFCSSDPEKILDLLPGTAPPPTAAPVPGSRPQPEILSPLPSLPYATVVPAGLHSPG